MECLVIYGYRIKPERIAEFEATYSVTGAWAGLLRTVPGYLGTQLLCRGEGDYATIDRWSERAAYDHFRSLHAYDDLYERCAALKLSDGLIGIFEVISQ
jgi:antibiotic biosynthesis monooxygenase (ABM) superfamily enzyme